MYAVMQTPHISGESSPVPSLPTEFEIVFRFLLFFSLNESTSKTWRGRLCLRADGLGGGSHVLVGLLLGELPWACGLPDHLLGDWRPGVAGVPGFCSKAWVMNTP